MLDGGGGTGPRASLGPAYGYQICRSICHTSRNGTHTGFRNQLHRYFGFGVHILQIEYQLRQVFDGVDIMVRGR